MEMFFDWRREERDSLIFIGTAVIALILSICLGMMLYTFNSCPQGVRSIVAGLLIIWTFVMAFKRNLKYTILWSLLLIFIIELMIGLSISQVEPWLVMFVADLFILYMLVHHKIL